MIFNRVVRVGVVSGLVAAALSVGGCATLFGSTSHAPADAAPATQEDAAAPGPAPQLTATQAALQGDNGEQARTQPARPQPTAVAIRADAPRQYTVKRGDTLWGIASLFLRDPWEWPEIWYVNPRIRNPHLIYPGDVLVLAYGSDGRPQISLQQSEGRQQGGEVRLDPRLRSDPLADAIPTIPYASIAAFLTRPSLLSREQIKNSPYVLAFPDGHQAAGDGQIAYARGLKNAPVGARYSVVHVEDAIVDPDDGTTLGYQGTYTATAVVQRAAEITKTELVDTARETLRGDCMLPDETTTPLTFVPRAPTRRVNGKIIYVVNDVEIIGQYAIVAINRGKRDGVDAGTVLAIDAAGDEVEDRGAGTYDVPDHSLLGFMHEIQLPYERAGTLLVFKSYDRMSYGLVIGASGPMRVADVVRNP